MCYVAALYSNGRVVTGRNHGEAFTKLPPKDQDGELRSGFLDPRTGRFLLDDNSQFYLKKILLIRHAQPTDEQPDPGISEIGRMQCKRVANFVMVRFNLPDFEVFCSPVRRCRETMESIFGGIDIKKHIDPLYAIRGSKESVESFLERIHHALDVLPQYSIVISHCDYVVNMSQLALAMSDPSSFCQAHCDDCQWGCKISCGSVTYLEHNKPILVGMSDFQET